MTGQERKRTGGVPYWETVNLKRSPQAGYRGVRVGGQMARVLLVASRAVQGRGSKKEWGVGHWRGNALQRRWVWTVVAQVMRDNPRGRAVSGGVW
jgi:hypothetical protein